MIGIDIWLEIRIRSRDLSGWVNSRFGENRNM